MGALARGRIDASSIFPICRYNVEMTDSVRVRFAPSPTGALHLGSARTALYNWLYARKTGGQYLLRIEDTDTGRSTPEAEAQIHRTLAWLGLDSDDPSATIRQSRRADRYAEAARELLAAGHLYVDEAEPADESGRRPLRFRMPAGEIAFEDLVHGPRLFDADAIRDPLVVRSDGSVMYNLACAIDDADMQITHVIRGDDHLANTPLQVSILRALGRPVPVYAHLPMILDSEGDKLSKRTGAASVEDYMHYLPEALLNYLALLGWSAPEGRTILSRDELVELFSFDHVGKSPGRFDQQLLDHIQGEHIRALDADEWKARYPGHVDPDVAHFLMHDKALTWADEVHLLRPLTEPFVIDPSEEISFDFAQRQLLGKARAALDAIDGEWTEEKVGRALREMCKALNVKAREAIPVVQWAVMGQRRGTSVFRVLPLLGRERAFGRIDAAMKASPQQMHEEMIQAVAPDTVIDDDERTLDGEIVHEDDPQEGESA
jgi:glutamyl/glutaminyl-tRNA synthetase